MNRTSDDVSKRVPALFAGRTLHGTLTEMVTTSRHAGQQLIRSTVTAIKAKPKTKLAAKQKNIIVALLAINLTLVGLTAHQDHPGRVQQAQAIETMVVSKSSKTITVQPVKAPEAQIATITAEKVEPTPTPTPAPQVAGVTVKRFEGNVGAMLRQAATSRWGEAEAESLITLMGKESGLNPYAVNRSSGACGIPQAYPCSKLIAVIGSLDNVEGQIQWLLNYIHNRYGTPGQALAFHRANNWY